MNFDVRTIIKLVNAGFNVEEIEDILAPKDTNGSDPTPAAPTPAAPTPAAPEASTPAAPAPAPAPAAPTPATPTPAPAPAAPTPAAPTPASADQTIDDLKNVVNEGFKSIIEALQVSAVGGSSQSVQEAKTSEAILAEIISPFDIKIDKKFGGNKL